MNRKCVLLSVLFILVMAVCSVAAADTLTTNGGTVIDFSELPYQSTNAPATVYFISDISPESLIKAYQALGVELPGMSIL